MRYHCYPEMCLKGNGRAVGARNGLDLMTVTDVEYAYDAGERKRLLLEINDF